MQRPQRASMMTKLITFLDTGTTNSIQRRPVSDTGRLAIRFRQ